MMGKLYKEAFRTILNKSVSATSTSEIVLIYDEIFQKYFEYFSEVINESLFKVTYIFVPISYQNVLQNNRIFYNNEEIQLPTGINAAINRSNIVFNFLTGSRKSSKVRGAVLNYIKDNGCKVVHCPNISDEVLELVVNSDFEEIYSDCETMAWAIGNSDTAVILTTGPKGEQFELVIKLGGWTNDPFISGGVIFENSWGNVPPGETLCCPKPNNISGSICINGSIPGYLFKDGEYLILIFNKGKITHWEAPLGSDINLHINKIEKEAKEFNDPNWNTFAELGIGMNPSITKLTGNPLYDEKMAGTIHIAIGDNVGFGHGVQSHMHEDLVITSPTLFLDDKLVIDKGKVNFEMVRNWRSEFKAPKIEFNELNSISFKHAKIHLSSNKIQRKLSKGQRVGYINIFRNEHKSIVRSLREQFIKEEMDDIKIIDFVKKLRKRRNSRLMLEEVMEILIHYKMAKLK